MTEGSSYRFLQRGLDSQRKIVVTGEWTGKRTTKIPVTSDESAPNIGIIVGVIVAIIVVVVLVSAVVWKRRGNEAEHRGIQIGKAFYKISLHAIENNPRLTF